MEFKTVRTQETSASETNTTLKRKLGAVIAAAAVGLTGAACESNTGAVRHYGAEAGSETIHGQECFDSPDKVLTTGELNGYEPFASNGISEEKIVEYFDEDFYREDQGLLGFGRDDVRLSPQQVSDIQLGVNEIKNDLSKTGSPSDIHHLSYRINVLNTSGEQTITDEGYIDGKMCVDGGTDEINTILANVK